MSTKIITVAAAGSVPAPSSGADYNKGAPLNAVEFDQNIVNLRNAVDAALAALAGYSTGNASGNIPVSNGTVNTNLNADMVDGFHASQTPAANQVPVLNSAATLPVNGVKFPATQVASSDPNTLDDYEEGSFTPIVVGGTITGTCTYAIQKGKYTKIGNVVHFKLYVSWSAHTGTGTLFVGGMPFAAPNDGSDSSVSAAYPSGITLTANNVLTARVVYGSQIRIAQYPIGGGTVSDVAVVAAAQIEIAGSYFI